MKPPLAANIAVVALATTGLSVQSAHVENYGERAVDAFYIHQDDGGKLIDSKAINALKAELADVLADEETQAPRGRPKMQRARASSAR